MRVTGMVLMYRNQTWHAATFDIFRPHCMTRAFRRDHKDVDIGTWLNQVKMHIQTMRKGNRRACTNIAGDICIVNISLQFVRRQHHHDIGPCSRFGHIHDLKTSVLCFCPAARVCAQCNSHFDNTAIFQICRMGMTLAAISNNNNLLLLDQPNIGIPIIIDTHWQFSPLVQTTSLRRWHRGISLACLCDIKPVRRSYGKTHPRRKHLLAKSALFC